MRVFVAAAPAVLLLLCGGAVARSFDNQDQDDYENQDGLFYPSRNDGGQGRRQGYTTRYNGDREEEQGRQSSSDNSFYRYGEDNDYVKTSYGRSNSGESLPESFKSEKLTTSKHPHITSISASYDNVFVGLQNGVLLRLNEKLSVKDTVESITDTVNYIDSDESNVVIATTNKVSLYSHQRSSGLKKLVEKKIDGQIYSVRLFPTYVIIGGVNKAKVLSRSDLSEMGTIDNPECGNIEQHQISSYGNEHVIIQGGKGRLRVYEINSASRGQTIKPTQTLHLPKQNDIVSSFDIIRGSSETEKLHLAVGYKNGGLQIVKSSSPVVIGRGPSDVTFQVVSEVQKTRLNPTHVIIVEDSSNNQKILVVNHQKGTIIFTVDESNKLDENRKIELGTSGSYGQFSVTSRAVYYLDDASNRVSARSLESLLKQIRTSGQYLYNDNRDSQSDISATYKSEKLTTNEHPQITYIAASDRDVYVTLQRGLLLRLNEKLSVTDKTQIETETVKYMDSDDYEVLIATAHKIALYTKQGSKGLVLNIEKKIDYQIHSALLFPTFILIGGVNQVRLFNRFDLSDIGTIDNPESGNIEQYHVASFGYNGFALQAGKGRLRVFERQENASKQQSFRATRLLHLPKQNEVVSTFDIFFEDSQDSGEYETGRLCLAVAYKSGEVHILKATAPFEIGRGPSDVTFQTISQIQKSVRNPSQVKVVQDSSNPQKILFVDIEQGTTAYTIDENNKLDEERKITLGSSGRQGQFTISSRAVYYLDDSSNRVSGKSFDSINQQLMSNNRNSNVDENNTIYL